MMRKENKCLIAKIILFISTVLFFMICYYKLFYNFQKYGIEPYKGIEYIESKRFETDFANILTGFETSINVAFKNYTENESSANKDFPYFNWISSNLKYILDIKTTDGNEHIYSNMNIKSENLKNEMDNWEKTNHYYICSLNEKPITDMEKMVGEGFHADQNVFEKLDVYVRVDNVEANDGFYKSLIEYNEIKDYGKIYATLALICVLLAICSLVYLAKNLEKDKRIFLDNLYNEELILILICILYLWYKMVTFWMFVNFRNEIKWIIALVAYFLLHSIYFVIVKRIKTNEIANNFLIGKSIKNVDKIYIPIVVDIIIFIFSTLYGEFYITILISLVGIIVMLHIFNMLIEYSELNIKIKNILNKSESEKINYRNPIFKNLVENINNLQAMINEQVKNEIKAERLKADLITNVSHDLKTPITSIINYTQLLKKENIQNENAKRYIEVLENKSTKLKNLTDDLIEISKITSGNEIATLEKLNISEIIMQANGEFEEKFESRNLKIISNFSSDEIYAYIDSKKMWRVLENLYINIYKYALEDSRVYVDIKQEKEKIIISLKNISKEELNIEPEELLERFVRGDKSRSISGNGLGLSIAKELVILQKGEFKIFIDGDLFRVDIILTNMI